MTQRLKSERSKRNSPGKSSKMKPKLSRRGKNRESVENMRNGLVVPGEEGSDAIAIDQMMATR